MKRKIFILLVISILGICVGCNKNSYAIDFKKEYESINGETGKSGKIHRTVKIDNDNPYQKTTIKNIIEKIENKETFYVYFGDKLCPWCRSVIEKSIEVAKNNKINKIYYVAIWDDDGNEVVRDKYELVDGEVRKTIDGDENYPKLLELFDELLSDYNLTDSDGNKVSTNEKRIYAPNFIYVENGIPKKIETGISEKQTDSREELTKEILEDEEELFNKFFKK